MAEGTYEYECMRAELLGLEKPDHDEFMKNKLENEKKEVEEEEVDTNNLNEADHHKEGLNRISGGLEELNSILKKTQVKINRFKASCGSITNLLKIKSNNSKAGSSSSLDDNSADPQTETANTIPTEEMTTDTSNGKSEEKRTENGTKPRKSDLAKALDTDLNRIDSMIDKAENAQYSMEHQRKEMARFLK